MKHRTIIATLCAILLALPGCERTAAPGTVGPFDVNGGTGVATGQAFGIEFKVSGASKAEVTSGLSGNPRYSSRAEITLADDLRIARETVGEGNSVTLQLNGKEFGDLERGDEVVIEADRSVMVSGERRIGAESLRE